MAAPLVPAVNPKKSVTPDFIICLEDGKKFKSLKRHLGVHFGLTRTPIAPNGACRGTTRWSPPTMRPRARCWRSSIGLGRKAAPVKAPAKGTKGRKAKA